MYPLVKLYSLIDPNTLIIDAKSGTSGAGARAKVNNLFCEVNEKAKGGHMEWQHTVIRARDLEESSFALSSRCSG